MKKAIRNCVLRYIEENELMCNEENIMIHTDLLFAIFHSTELTTSTSFVLFLKAKGSADAQELYRESFMKGGYSLVVDTDIFCVIRSGLMPIATSSAHY